MTRRSFVLWWSLVTLGVVALELPPFVAFPLVLVFIMFVPGFAIVSRMGITPAAVEVMLAIGISLGLGALVTEVLLYTELYNALSATAALAAIACYAALVPPPLPREATVRSSQNARM